MLPKVISSRTIKSTRKPHKCWGCTREFLVDSTLLCCVTASDEALTSTYWCDRCQEITANDSDAIYGYNFGDLAEVSQ